VTTKTVQPKTSASRAVPDIERDAGRSQLAGAAA
jgi:hypothetical protein